MGTEQSIATAQPIEPERMPSLVFLRDTFRLYHSNMWLFLKLIAPAVVFGYIAIYLGQERANEIMRHLPRGPGISDHILELLEMGLSRFTGFAVSWLVYCFAFAGVCTAVERLESGIQKTTEDLFAPARERAGALVRLSVVLFLLVLFAFAISMFVMGAFLIGVKGRFHTTAQFSWFLGAAFSFLSFLVVSKFGLAIPALVLDGHGITKSLFLSDEMTAGRWNSLAVLLLESVGGSYIASVLPFWVASLLAERIALPLWSDWMLYVIAIVGSALLVPNMLVGCALLYVRTRNRQQAPVPADSAQV